MFVGVLPHFARDKVIKGFGRGSKELGIPTANLPLATIEKLPKELTTGVYFGWARVDNGPVYKMVMSIGWNPFYKNKEKSMEIHLLHVFENDFYGCTLSVIMLGHIRPEEDFDNVEELIKTIKTDISMSHKELEKPEFIVFKDHPFLTEKIVLSCGHLTDPEEKKIESEAKHDKSQIYAKCPLKGGDEEGEVSGENCALALSPILKIERGNASVSSKSHKGPRPSLISQYKENLTQKVYSKTVKNPEKSGKNQEESEDHKNK